MNDLPPLVTTGMPTHDRQRLVKRAIKSALAQDYPHVDVDVMNKRWTDGRVELCREFAPREARIQYVATGPAAAATSDEARARVYVSVCRSRNT
jgi:hypothetical protein